LTESNCDLYESALADVVASDAYKEARYWFYENYKSDLETLVGWSNITETNFDDICEYMFFSSFNTSIVSNFTPTAYDRAYCMAYENGWVYKTSYGIR
jgi:hypothetical protein